MKVAWEQIDQFVRRVADIAKHRSFTGVYGPARGGLPLAVWVSHRAGLPLLAAPAKGCLIVDDIADTGETLAKYAGLSGHAGAERHFIATVFYKRTCSFEPDLWLFEKGAEWIVFPWEE